MPDSFSLPASIIDYTFEFTFSKDNIKLKIMPPAGEMWLFSKMFIDDNVIPFGYITMTMAGRTIPYFKVKFSAMEHSKQHSIFSLKFSEPISIYSLGIFYLHLSHKQTRNVTIYFHGKNKIVR